MRQLLNGRMRLGTLLTLRNVLVAVVATLVAAPLVVFWLWPHSSALQNQLDEVRDRHLLIARNLGAALQRYHRDARATFDFAADGLLAGARTPISGALMDNLRFRSICLVEEESGRIVAGATTYGQCTGTISPDRLKFFREIAVEGSTVLSGVHASRGGEPIMCFVRRFGPHMVIGILDTAYFVELGKSVSFGIRGHAVIVDHEGKVLAHPLSSWEKEMRDISKVSAVKRMLAGETGVDQFFSPAFKDDMVTGFTAVSGPGWGVMVPQPISELRQIARAIQTSAMLIFAVGLVGAVLAAIALAYVIVRPLNHTIKAAGKMAKGQRDIRLGRSSRFMPRELRVLTATFNKMADRVSRLNSRLEERVAERTRVAEQALQELSASHDALLVATKAKSDFLATMSHEIRTPMNGVLGMLGLLMKTELSKKQRQLCSSAHKSAESLLVILNDILDYSKLEAGHLSLEKLNFEIEPLLGDVVDIFKPSCDAKHLGLELKVTSDIAGQVVGDPSRLRQVLLNLVGNAVKFTDTGTVGIHAICRDMGDDRVNLRIEISDTGIGIPDEVLAKLFTSFTQGDASVSRKFGGTGLGLSISKRLTELMGGQIGVSSAVGKGSTFWIELDMPRSDLRETVAEHSKVQNAASASELRILVAEDNPVNQAYVEQILLDAGHKVDLVVNGREAVMAVNHQRYDLVLMDIQMPEMDGVRATCIIRALESPARSIPIIAVTANVSRDEQREYLAAGMDSVVAKPFDDGTIFGVIADVLEWRRPGAKTAANGARRPSGPASRTVTNSAAA